MKGRIKPRRLITEEGWLVLDLNSKPVKSFRMPFALSSKLEPFLMEAIMRENYDMDIQVQDIRARMPGNLVNGVDKLRTATLSMAMNRFRNQAALTSWTGKIGSENIKEYLDALLPPECLAANSTRDFRNLHPHEVEEMHLMNAGNFPNKARPENKDFSDANKKKQFDKVVAKYKSKRKQFDGSTEFTETYYKVLAKREERDRRARSDFMDVDTETEGNGSEEEVEDEVKEEEEENDDDAKWGDSDASCYHSSDGFWTPEPKYGTPTQTIDFRQLLPATDSQVALIQMMLLPSQIQFYKFTGDHPPQFDRNAGYLTQYNRLQSAMVALLAGRGQDATDLQLIGLTVFTDAQWDWNGPWFVEYMGEEPNGATVLAMVEVIKQEIAAEQSAMGQVVVDTVPTEEPASPSFEELMSRFVW